MSTDLRNRHYVKHIFWPQCYEARNQFPERKKQKRINMWRLYNILHKTQWVNDQNQETQWANDAKKPILRWKFRAVHAFTKEQEKS